MPPGVGSGSVGTGNSNNQTAFLFNYAFPGFGSLMTMARALALGVVSRRFRSLVSCCQTTRSSRIKRSKRTGRVAEDGEARGGQG